MCKYKNEKEKVRKNNARIYEKKSKRSEKLHKALRELKCAYTKKNDFSF